MLLDKEASYRYFISEPDKDTAIQTQKTYVPNITFYK